MLRLAVSVLNEDCQQFQCVAVRARRASGRLIHEIELWPGPSFVLFRFERMPVHLSFDRGWIEHHLVAMLFVILEWVRGAAAADDADRIHAVGAKAQGPQQARRRHFAVHLAVVRAVLDLYLIVFCDRAGELWRIAGHLFVHPVAGERLVRLDRPCTLGSGLQIHHRYVGRLPNLGTPNRRQPSLFRQVMRGRSARFLGALLRGYRDGADQDRESGQGETAKHVRHDSKNSST